MSAAFLKIIVSDVQCLQQMHILQMKMVFISGFNVASCFIFVKEILVLGQYKTFQLKEGMNVNAVIMLLFHCYCCPNP